MSPLFIFPMPLDAICELRHDTAGWTLTAAPAVHPEGRPGQAFTIPDATPNANGVALTISAKGYHPLLLRGVLLLNPPSLQMDDFHLTKGASLPRLVQNGGFFAQEG